MRTSRRTAGAAGLLAAALAVPSQHAGAASAPDLDRLQRSLDAATARTVALGEQLEQQAAQDGGVRIALDRLTQQHDEAQGRLDARVRSVWITRRPDPLAGWVDDVAAPSLRRIARQGAAAAVAVDRDLVDAVAQRAAATERLRASSEGYRGQLRRQASQALAAQEGARSLLAQAELLLAVQTAAATQQADRDRLAESARQLASARARLDASSAVVTSALTPAQSRRSARAQAEEAPLLALVEAAGSSYPRGYSPTGQVISGLASWYGPGFVGRPTASGAPYDPERLSCAHKTLPLRTVLRVSANGRTVSCLVNDRGPYVGPRVLDMSRAGSRTLDFDGVQAVVIEVLAPE